MDAELDATDQLEFPDQNPDCTSSSALHPQIAALEALIYPTAADLVAENLQASIGTIEIAPMQAPLTLFVWSPQRIIPVRITEFTVVEDTFDPALNPIRAKVSLGMRVLSVDDLGYSHPGGTLFLGTCTARRRSPAARQGDARGARHRGHPMNEALRQLDALLSNAAAVSPRFPPNSRYNGLPTLTHVFGRTAVP